DVLRRSTPDPFGPDVGLCVTDIVVTDGVDAAHLVEELLHDRWDDPGPAGVLVEKDPHVALSPEGRAGADAGALDRAGAVELVDLRNAETRATEQTEKVLLVDAGLATHLGLVGEGLDEDLLVAQAHHDVEQLVVEVLR